MKEIKLKKCKVCSQKFVLERFNQQTCDYKCAIQLAKNKQKEKEQKEWKAEKAILKDKLKTLSDYAKELQKEVNTIVRLIDKDTQCISTLKPLNNKFDAGHFYSVGSNPSLRFHLGNDQVWLDTYGYEWFICEKRLAKLTKGNITANWCPETQTIEVMRLVDNQIMERQSFSDIAEFDKFDKFLNPPSL